MKHLVVIMLGVTLGAFGARAQEAPSESVSEAESESDPDPDPDPDPDSDSDPPLTAEVQPAADPAPTAEAPPQEESMLPFPPWAVFGIQSGISVASLLVTIPLFAALAIAVTPLLPGTFSVVGFRGGGPDALPAWAALLSLGLLAPPATFLAAASVAWVGAWLAQSDSYPWISLTTAAVLTVVGTGALIVVTGLVKSELARTISDGDTENAAGRYVVPIATAGTIVALGVPLLTAAAFAIETGELE